MKAALILTLLAACGDPPIDPNKPAAPDENDAAYSSTGLNGWYLIGDAATAGNDQLDFTITAPGDADVVDAYVADKPAVRMDKAAGGFHLAQAIGDLPAGAYDILFTKNGDHTAFAKVTFDRSAPYYVLVSTDYDFSDPGDNSTTFMDQLHTDHPDLVITHFWAPYTYTDPAVTEDRRNTLTAWIKNERDTYGDEIGLHIHPYCNFVEDAGITCVTNNSDVYPEGDTTGYTTILASYDRPTLGTLLQHAKDLFSQRGLNVPVTFRAGGWTADLSSLQAMNDQGFVADTSALNWARIEEWKGRVIYDWTMAHWAPIGDTSQPYYPSDTDADTSAPGSDMAMLEVPDNGAMVDYVSYAEMLDIFNANWDGTPLAKSPVMMMGFHPSTELPQQYMSRASAFLKLADMHLASTGLGPVVYITLSDIVPVFPAQ
ncbi:MAG: hypothetical protein QM831_09815 [Kofleriaceae bacterium]